MTIYNKSTHPIEVKKISIRLWSLRDEIEAAIGRRIKECEAAGVPLYIDDIKKFYNLDMKAPLTEQDNVLKLIPKAEGEATDGVTSMMETLGEEAAAAPAPEISPIDPSASSTPESVEAAAALAAKTFNQAEEIIADQNSKGLETKKPNPILDRPYQRQAPDLDKVSYGFTLLSDLHMDAFLCFTKDKFLHGQSVVVEFLIPQNFMMTAEIIYCHFYALRSRIISSTKPDYRLQSKFNFSIPGERENMRNFLKSIEPTLPHESKKIKKESSEDDILGI